MHSGISTVRIAAITCVIAAIAMIGLSDLSDGYASDEPYITASDSSHTEIFAGSFADSIENTYSETTDKGNRFWMEFEMDPSRIPSYIAMHNAKGTFNFSVSMDLSQTHYKDQGLIVYVGEYHTTLVPSNNFKNMLMDGGKRAALSPDTEYPVSFYTVGGVPTEITLDSLSDAKISFLWRSAGDASFLCFMSEDGIIESRYILPGEPIGTIPDESDHKGTFLGWFDSFGNEVSEDTVYDMCNDLLISERWKGGFGPEVFIITTILTLNVYICLYLIFSRPRTR